MIRAHVFVTGFVQGVFFRHSAAERARKGGLTGWVRNLPDGRVEAIFEGEDEPVRAMIEWCRSGPPHATVEQFEVEISLPTGEFPGFRAL